MATIAVDGYSLIHPFPTGVEYYAKEVLTRLPIGSTAPDSTWQIYVPAQQKKDLLPAQAYPLRWPFARGFVRARIPLELFLHPPRVYFTPSHALPPRHFSSTRLCATIHDVAFLDHPELYSAPEVHHHTRVLLQTIRQATALFAVSQATADALTPLIPSGGPVVHVTPLAVDGARFYPRTSEQVASVRHEHGLSGEYILHVGRLDRKKGIDLLLQAFLRYTQKHGKNSCELVLTGPHGDMQDEVRSFMAMHPYVPIRILGYVAHEDVPLLMQGAAACVFPSKAEGFGLPNIEALAVGCPLITSDIPVHHEVAKDAAVFVPAQVEAWVEAIECVLHRSEEEANRSRTKGFDVVRALRWGETAKKTQQVLEGLL